MEMKNICGKIPVELHEKLKLEVEELGISIPKYLEMVIEEHITRKGEKTDMANLRTVAVQVDEELFSRLKAVLAKNGMKQKDFLIGLIEAALEKEEAKWKAESEETEEEPEVEEAEPEETEPAELEPKEDQAEKPEPETEESEREELELEAEEEPTEPELEEPEETEPAEADEEGSAEPELETEEPGATEPEEAEA
ncbi:hypothetical protein NE590_03145 [Blautia obeum]|uniref:hypothetical protein n=1 Tax=Blautia obeum TaxID=40520 RepID=UPI00210AF52D|nr:hypothetical protein [Blautia obeum]MCQ4788857.1 hypothetical protein [Blautia obeum]